MNHVKTEPKAQYASQHLTDEQILLKAKLILDSQLRTSGYDFTSPDKVRLYLRAELQRLEHEEFWVLFLDNQHKLIKAESMFRGTIDGASVYPREVAKRCLQLNAAAVIFAHNHPSGLAEESRADRTITSKLKDALGIFDIRVLDHFIVGEEVMSFSEKGIL